MGTDRFGVLLGNSRLRYGRFEGLLVSGSGALDWEAFVAEDAGGLLELLGDGQAEVVVGSVRDDRLEDLGRRLDGFTLLVAGRDFEIPIENHYENPGEAGTDRLLNALAVRVRWPGEAVIVVDFGTALSISVVSEAGEFLGGPIGVGERTALRGLENSTPQLPGVGDGPELPLIARGTEQAIRAGVRCQVRSGVLGLIEGIRSELGSRARVVATGGEAGLVAVGSEFFDSIEPDLTLEGLAAAAAAGL
ncbi:MAG: type III pantothenate kinase [Planctomycetota bacterium]|nr:type III pantothenate kinase [Planctomycetota bacterium]